jgi:signal transduction histidine kinase
MENREQTILLVSDDAGLYAATRREFEAREQCPRIATVSTIDAARRIMEDSAPDVILLEDSSVICEINDPLQMMPRLAVVVSDLSGYAPVVVIGRADQEAGMSTLVASGAADFVTRAGGCLPLALGMVERRLRETKPPIAAPEISQADAPAGESFGELLRHELNNPLTGILGNAELLLAEVRRKNDGRLPQGGQQRLETIAELAVRLRETVRRLSQDWETRHNPLHKTA